MPLPPMPQTKGDAPLPTSIPGLALRDYFAGQALGQLWNYYNAECGESWSWEDLVRNTTRSAYELADGMLAARAYQESDGE